MKAAYVDTSCLVAIALDEPGSAALASRLEEFDLLISSNLLEAEFRSALSREDEQADPAPFFKRITWVHPSRSLSREIRMALEAGHLRGPDLYHLASALYLAPRPGELHFLTLDVRQKQVARKAGFAIDESISSGQ